MEHLTQRQRDYMLAAASVLTIAVFMPGTILMVVSELLPTSDVLLGIFVVISLTVFALSSLPRQLTRTVSDLNPSNPPSRLLALGLTQYNILMGYYGIYTVGLLFTPTATFVTNLILSGQLNGTSLSSTSEAAVLILVATSLAALLVLSNWLRGLHLDGIAAIQNAAFKAFYSDDPTLYEFTLSSSHEALKETGQLKSIEDFIVLRRIDSFLQRLEWRDVIRVAALSKSGGLGPISGQGQEAAQGGPHTQAKEGADERPQHDVPGAPQDSKAPS